MADDERDPTRVLGQLIEQARRTAALSQDELGDRLDVRQQSVQAWENGASKPKADRWPQLEDLFGWPRGYISRVLAGEAVPDDEMPDALRSQLPWDDFTDEEKRQIVERVRGYMDAIKDRRRR